MENRLGDRYRCPIKECSAQAITLDPEFSISDQCITCYCCVELCPEGALEVPDVEAYRHY